jgi:alkylated DNA repair protein (DNA oxidative demethylase)
MTTISPGVTFTPAYLDRAAQDELLAAVRAVIAAAPLYVPRMPRSGAPMSVLMTNCGALGWVTDAERGYRYQAAHPKTGAPWPPIPEILLKAWRELGGYPHEPQACLVNYYAPSARMGLHQDKDAAIRHAPCGWRRAMPSCSAARAASRTTASTAFLRGHQLCCQRADGSI